MLATYYKYIFQRKKRFVGDVVIRSILLQEGALVMEMFCILLRGVYTGIHTYTNSLSCVFKICEVHYMEITQ